MTIFWVHHILRHLMVKESLLPCMQLLISSCDCTPISNSHFEYNGKQMLMYVLAEAVMLYSVFVKDRLQRCDNAEMTDVTKRGLECTGEAGLAAEQHPGRKRTFVNDNRTTCTETACSRVWLHNLNLKILNLFKLVPGLHTVVSNSAGNTQFLWLSVSWKSQCGLYTF